jgi:hypothetical protein
MGNGLIDKRPIVKGDFSNNRTDLNDSQIEGVADELTRDSLAMDQVHHDVPPVPPKGPGGRIARRQWHDGKEAGVAREMTLMVTASHGSVTSSCGGLGSRP